MATKEIAASEIGTATQIALWFGVMSKEQSKEQTAARAYLAQIGWTQRGLAAHIGVHETRVRRMLTGESPMDPDVFRWLKRLADFHAAHPAPQLEPLRRLGQ